MTRPSILVVEDYPDLASAIVEALQRSDYSCELVGSSADAVEKLRDHSYAAILLAPRTPVKSDPVLHFLAKNQPAQLGKLVLMTTPGDAEGQPHVLEKPFNSAQLLAEIAAVRTAAAVAPQASPRLPIRR